MLIRISLFMTCLLVIIGCSEKVHLSENGEIAKNYLEGLGYEVISHVRDSYQVFSKSDMRTTPGQQIWSVQPIEPDEYFDKRIETVTFTIKNHPLDDQYNMSKTSVTVYLYDGKVIGGWSFPIAKEGGLNGAPYSLDGRTLEDIHGDFSDWQEEWNRKYGN